MTPTPAAPAAPQTSTAAALIAGFIALLGFPVGGALFGLASRGEVAEAFNEGGWPMYLIVLLALVLSLCAALGTFFLARGKPALWTLIPGASVAMLAVGVFGYSLDVGASMQAVMNASPLDRGRIMFGAVGESMQNVTFALAFITGAYLVQILALAIVTAASPQRRAPAALLVGALGLAVWQFASLQATSYELDAFKGMAHASPMDRATIVIGSLQMSQELRPLLLAGLGLALVGVVLAVVLLRATPQAMAGVAASILVSVAGLGGLRVLARPTHEVATTLQLAMPPRDLKTLAGGASEGPYPFITLGKTFKDADGQTPALEDVVRGRDVVELGLEPDVTLDSLRATLRAFKAARVKVVKLFGVANLTPPPDVELPAYFKSVLTVTTSVTVVLVDACPREGCAQVDDAGLTWDGEKLPFVERSYGYTRDDFEHGVPVALGAMTLDRLLACGVAADAKSRSLQLVLGAEQAE